MKVILPIKEESSRLPNKNFRRFHGDKSLVEIKVRQLLEHFNRSDIFIVGDGPRCQKVASDFDLQWLDDKKFSNKGFATAIRYWLTQIIDDDVITITLCTTPLFTYYDEILAAWDRDSHDSILDGSPIKEFILNEYGPLNFQCGYYHKIKQDLPTWFRVNCSCFMIDGIVARDSGYFIGRKPQIFIPPSPSIDIDNQEDFELAQWYFARKMS